MERSAGPRSNAAIRSYLIVVAAGRHLVTGVNALLFPQMFEPAADVFPIIKLIPLWLWTSLILGVGLWNLVDGIVGNVTWGRRGLIATATATFAIGAGIAIGSAAAAIQAPAATVTTLYPEIALLVLALSAADYIVLSMHWPGAEPELPPLPERE